MSAQAPINAHYWANVPVALDIPTTSDRTCSITRHIYFGFFSLCLARCYLIGANYCRARVADYRVWPWHILKRGNCIFKYSLKTLFSISL